MNEEEHLRVIVETTGDNSLGEAFSSLCSVHGALEETRVTGFQTGSGQTGFSQKGHISIHFVTFVLSAHVLPHFVIFCDREPRGRFRQIRARVIQRFPTPSQSGGGSRGLAASIRRSPLRETVRRISGPW